jgi:hypothetical protein
MPPTMVGGPALYIETAALFSKNHSNQPPTTLRGFAASGGRPLVAIRASGGRPLVAIPRHLRLLTMEIKMSTIKQKVKKATLVGGVAALSMLPAKSNAQIPDKDSMRQRATATTQIIKYGYTKEEKQERDSALLEFRKSKQQELADFKKQQLQSHKEFKTEQLKSQKQFVDSKKAELDIFRRNNNSEFNAYLDIKQKEVNLYKSKAKEEFNSFLNITNQEIKNYKCKDKSDLERFKAEKYAEVEKFIDASAKSYADFLTKSYKMIESYTKTFDATELFIESRSQSR